MLREIAKIALGPVVTSYKVLVHECVPVPGTSTKSRSTRIFRYSTVLCTVLYCTSPGGTVAVPVPGTSKLY